MNRLKQLSQQLEEPCLIENPTDLLYLTGLHLSKGRLLVTPAEATLFVDGRYLARAKNSAPCSVVAWEEFKKIAHPQIGFDSAFISYDSYLSLKQQFPSIDWIPRPYPIKQLRLIKEEAEVQALKRAAQVTWKGYKHILQYLKEGVSEADLAFEFEFFCRKNGASGLSFEPIIAFGENSAYPHHRAGTSRLKSGQVVLIDVGAVVDQYHGDMTRIFHFGSPDPQIVRLEEIVRTAQKKAIAQIRPGIEIGQLDQIVQDAFEHANVKQLYIHSLGHGIGLETHEFPRIRFDGEDRHLILQPGMVFTIEPGLYQPGVGGVRIEDMIHVTKSGFENLFMQESDD